MTLRLSIYQFLSSRKVRCHSRISVSFFSNRVQFDIVAAANKKIPRDIHISNPFEIEKKVGGCYFAKRRSELLF